MHHLKFQKKGGDAESEMISRQRSNFSNCHIRLHNTQVPRGRKGYHADYAAAVTACSSIIGPIIPPSIIMVVYATTLRNLSLIDLFVAGLIPGLLMGGALLIVSGWISWRRDYASTVGRSIFERGHLSGN